MSEPKPIPPHVTLSKEQLNSYDHIIVMFSGGKDSIACHLHLLEQGVDQSKIELWHHDIDGQEGSDLFDWPCTRAYCELYAKAFNTPIYFSWKEGGFEREMTRLNQKTARTWFEYPGEDGKIYLAHAGGTRGKEDTRMKFPQVSSDLSVRWCSAYLKIDVATTAINNQLRFRGKRVLVVTGERGEESPNRAKYAMFEPHKADLRNGKRYQRHIDHYRPVRDWTEGRVWAIMQLYKVLPHPAYRLGFGRVSCQFCIFGNADQFATAAFLAELRGNALQAYEEKFGVTMKRNISLEELIAKGEVYEATLSQPELAALSQSKEYNEIIIVEKWERPAGAFAECGGPS